MDIVTLGAAKAQTEKYVSTHFVNGANITITDNADGTQTIAASGEVSSEDTVARGEIADHVADKTNPHEVTAAQVGLGNVDNTSDANKPVSTATQAALDLKANTSALATVATTGAYSDLSGTPTIPTVNNSTITIQKNGATVDSFTTNASSAKSINITVPTTASDVGALADTVKYAGASSAGGSATSAVKLDNAADAGSLTQPIFFESGKPKATTYSLAKSVPSNAVFTDTTYSFEGTYDASTNKGATMADIKDGKLTGYAQESGDVAATDKVVEAIGKVEKKADDNKTNILYNTNNGVKNIVNIQVPSTVVRTSYTPLSNGGVELSCTSAVWTAYNIENIGIEAGVSYTIKALVDESTATDLHIFVRETNASGTNLASHYYGNETGEYNANFTSSRGTIWLGIYLNNSATARTATAKIRVMICPKTIYDSDNSYQPHAMSNVELTKQRRTRRLGRWVTSFTVETPAFGATDEGGTITKVYIYMGGANTGLSEYILASESVALVTGGAGVTYSISGSTVTFTTTSTCLAYAETLHFDV